MFGIQRVNGQLSRAYSFREAADNPRPEVFRGWGEVEQYFTCPTCIDLHLFLCFWVKWQLPPATLAIWEAITILEMLLISFRIYSSENSFYLDHSTQNTACVFQDLASFQWKQYVPLGLQKITTQLIGHLELLYSCPSSWY